MRACFFSNGEREIIYQRQYTIVDIEILKQLGYEVIIATKYNEIPWNCDIYYSWWASSSILPLIVTLITRKPLIVVAGGNEAMLYRDSISNKPYGYLSTPWYKKIATRITLKLSTRILIVSEFMRSDVIKLGARDPILVHNAINTEIFVPVDIERSEIITIFSRERGVIELKRGYIILQAIPMVLNKYPHQIFTFIGINGNGHDEFVEKCKELGINNNVRFINNIPNEEIVNLIQRSKLYIQISDTETFGLSIAEAMSCEIPVVVSGRGAIPEVTGNLGLFVNHNDPKDVANGIIKILNMSTDDQKKLGKKLRERILYNFSFEKRKISIKKIIDSLVS